MQYMMQDILRPADSSFLVFESKIHKGIALTVTQAEILLPPFPHTLGQLWIGQCFLYLDSQMFKNHFPALVPFSV